MFFKSYFQVIGLSALSSENVGQPKNFPECCIVQSIYIYFEQYISIFDF